MARDANSWQRSGGPSDTSTMTLTAQLWLLDRSGLSPYSREFLEREWVLIQARIAEERERQRRVTASPSPE